MSYQPPSIVGIPFFTTAVAFGVGCCEIARIHADAEFNELDEICDT